MSEKGNSPSLHVSVRLIDSGGSALLAKADVAGSKMTINGFSVMDGKDGKGPWVAEPSMKAGSGYVRVLEITDRATRDIFTRVILEAYGKAVADRAANPSDPSDTDFPI